MSFPLGVMKARTRSEMAGRVFVVTLASRADDKSTIRELRALLKVLLRRHALRCVDIREIQELGNGNSREMEKDAIREMKEEA